MTTPTTVGDELNRAMRLFAQSGIDTPQLDAEILMSHALGTPRLHVISYPGQRLREEELAAFRAVVERRVKREPLAYITGEKEFWGLSFEVTPAVLVPRPETETLVDVALAQLRGEWEGEAPAEPVIADIGAGSGCVAIALAVDLPDAVICATEVSPAAAEVARRNAAKHQVEARVTVLEGDLFEPIPVEVRGRLDAVVSNPPYIPSADINSLQPEIKEYEPRAALDGGREGMTYHRRMLDAARGWLKPGGWVHLEVGASQAEPVAEMARAWGFRDVRITSDLAGIERVVSCKYDVQSR
jgi:release factor glutamine methyltransferase